MEDEYLNIDRLRQAATPNIHNEHSLNMYVTTGGPNLPDRPTTTPPIAPVASSWASVERRMVQRAQPGVYELAGGGRVLYDLSERRKSFHLEPNTSWIQTNMKNIGLVLISIVVTAAAVGSVVGVAIAIVRSSEIETGMAYSRKIGR